MWISATIRKINTVVQFKEEIFFTAIAGMAIRNTVVTARRIEWYYSVPTEDLIDLSDLFK